MFDFSEVFFSQPGKSSAIDLRVATDEVMDARKKRVTVLVEPLFFGFVSCLGKDRFRAPVFRFGWKIVPTFQEKNFATLIA